MLQDAGHGEERSGHGAVSTRCRLGYCHITAPITGRVGLRLVDPGNVVHGDRATTPLAVVTQMQPITVVFTIPEDDLGAGAAADCGSKAKLTVDAFDRASADARWRPGSC